MKLLFFEDLEEGSVHLGSECLADKEEMIEYSRKYDPWLFHIDESVAKQTPFRGLIASGGYIISLLYLSGHAIYNAPEKRWAFLGGLLDWNAKFHLPVRPGDRLQNRMTILDKRLSSKPGQGIVKNLQELVNQDNQVVFSLEVVFLMETCPNGSR